MHILYISDIHAQINNYQSKRMRRKLLEKVSAIHADKSISYVFLSGDITHQGQDFTDAHIKMIQEIMVICEIAVDKLLIVPGNHDLTRNIERTEFIENIYKNPVPSDFLDSSLNEQELLDVLLSSFDKFNDFHSKLKDESYPLQQIHSTVELSHCYLILINTCLIANKSGEEGSLLIAKDKLLDCLESIPKDGKPIIAMGHHTLECFSESDKQAILHLFDDYRVNIYLSGHVHQAGYDYKANNHNNLLTVVCSGIHFDGYTIGGFVDISINSNDAYITQYLWNHEHEYWTKNNTLGRRMENGTLIHNFKGETNVTTIPLPLEEDRRVELKRALAPLFNENEVIYKQYGPQSILAQQKPYSELAYIWLEKAISIIIPNNDKILELLENNKDLISNLKMPILDTYRNHVDGFKNNHLSEFRSKDIPLFPIEIYNILD